MPGSASPRSMRPCTCVRVITPLLIPNRPAKPWSPTPTTRSTSSPVMAWPPPSYDPEKGSALKRMNLFLRWMVRRDAVDPGVWRDVPASKLILPLDTHTFRISRLLGFTRRKSADLRAALESTAAFRRLNGDDPLKYDFSLACFGARGSADRNLREPSWLAGRIA